MDAVERDLLRRAADGPVELWAAVEAVRAAGLVANPYDLLDAVRMRVDHWLDEGWVDLHPAAAQALLDHQPNWGPGAGVWFTTTAAGRAAHRAAAELARVWERAPAGTAPPRLSVLTADVGIRGRWGTKVFAERIRLAVGAALEATLSAEELLAGDVAQWAEPFGRAELWEWLRGFRSAPRPWEWWDITAAPRKQVEIWLAPFADADLRGLTRIAHCAGATAVHGPEERPSADWEAAASLGA